MRIQLIPAFVGVLVSSVAFGAEYDFHVDFGECKTVVGYLVLSKESLKVMPGDPTVMACKRQSNTVRCDFVFKSDPSQKGRRGNSEEYKVIIDSPPLLHFMTDSGSEYVAIDTSQHAATLTTRILHQKFSGSKVCQGLYTTDFEMKNLGKK